MTWETREVPILRAVAAADVDGDGVENLDALVAATGLTRKQAVAGIRALLDDEYIDALQAGGFGNPDWLDITLRAKGREAVGHWPAPADPLDDLVQLLRQRADVEADPETQGKLRAAASALTDIGRQTIAGVLVDWIKTQTGR